MADILIIISAIAALLLFLLRVWDAYLARKFIKNHPELFKQIVAIEKNNLNTKTKDGDS